MGSRLLPLSLALAALAGDVGGLDRLSFYLVLLAVVGAAAAAFACIGDALAAKGSWAAGVSAGVALALLLLGSAVRASAAVGAGVPAVAVSTLAAAVLLYTLPVWAWLLAPLVPRPRPVRMAGRVPASSSR
jgi:hypothetical protein